MGKMAVGRIGKVSQNVACFYHFPPIFLHISFISEHFHIFSRCVIIPHPPPLSSPISLFLPIFPQEVLWKKDWRVKRLETKEVWHRVCSLFLSPLQ